MQAESTHRLTKPTTRNRYMVILVLVTFFVISLLTNVVGPLVPDIINSFHVSLTAAAFLAFSFFIAYAVMSIPAGFLLERLTEKPVMIMAFLAGTLGSLSFALFPHYGVAIASYFVMGAGMAVLQVAINPLLRISGGEEHSAFYYALAQFVFGAASFLSPRIYSYLVLNLGKPAEESAGSWEMYRSLARKKVVWMYFVSMFAYVGCEQGTADWISKFLSQYHGFDPHTTGAAAVSWFWGLMTAGCLVGMLLLKIFDSRRVLIGAACGALLCLSAALFGPARISLLAFPAIGLFASVMWPIVISLALNSVVEHHGSFAGILGTGMGIGGAVVPVIVGRIGDYAGLRNGMVFLYLTYGIILSIGFWAKPLISNETMDLRKSKS